ncbi:uncharacterized protein BP5553_08125 [Venustampulla echinocandica]|uniref:Uncharacterized protein n=1 Tax=Venustampulla echinocandica TaxID=2656787 RepID=A0A370TFT0_9HELO|nr:uncharacterized protein BP5553_08125 [Venustampulla echinocandica]RDL33757.1 hypothetical protein BP5553_08125 [Venustampulla echinocandica]
MSLFTLPLSAATQATTSRVNIPHGTSLPTRKRKRHRSLSPPSFEPYSHHTDNLHAASTNPLSLAPDEISQYRLAGLSLDEELPNQRGVNDWPHRGFPREKEFFTPPPKVKIREGKGKGKAVYASQDEGDGEEGQETRHTALVEEQRPRGHMLRIQHLSVLTAILHKSLLDGDIRRATRAYSLLLRAEFGGKALDIKSTGYWAIGAELLVRSLDRRRRRNIFFYESGYDSELDLDEEPPQEEGHAANEADTINKEKRWGTATGLSNAKSFYETLILQYPYKRQYHDYASALDVWPAMAACEIYGIQYEQRSALRKIKSSSFRYPSHEESEDERVTSDDEEGSPSLRTESSRHRRTRKRRERMEQVWSRRDNIRLDALTAAEGLASRMDEALNHTPFDRSHDMLHLRGMLALYIGDLSVPEMPDSINDDEDMSGDREHESIVDKRKRDRENIERLLLFRERVDHHKLGRQKRTKEWARARAFFDSSAREGGEAVALDTLDENADVDVDMDMDMDGEQEEDNLYDAGD